MGFEAWWFARLDGQDKDRRINDKALNYLWRPFSKHFGKQKELFTGVMKDHYCWSQGMWHDERFDNDDPVVVNPKLDTYNAPEKA